MKIPDLPPGERWPHGTRARYVALKCRCDACRKANRDYARERNEKAKEAAAAVTAVGGPSPQVWTKPDGTQEVRMYKRACPGVNGEPCSKGSHLRKDSKGGVCGECRKKLIWNGLVPADKAREHLHALSAKNVGRRAVSAACDVAETVLEEVYSGAKTQIRKDTETRILSVTEEAISDRALVPARPTWELVKKLRKMGYTKYEIGEELGSEAKVPSLQMGKKFITAAKAMKVAKLYARALEERKGWEEAQDVCADCGLSHGKKERQERLKKLLPCSRETLYERFPCLYGPTGEGDHKGRTTLRRDIQEIGAFCVGDLIAMKEG